MRRSACARTSWRPSSQSSWPSDLLWTKRYLTTRGVPRGSRAPGRPANRSGARVAQAVGRPCTKLPGAVYTVATRLYRGKITFRSHPLRRERKYNVPMRRLLPLVLGGLALSAVPQVRSEPFVPIGVWYGGGTV